MKLKEARYLYDKELANAQNTQNSIYLEIQNAFLTLQEKKKPDTCFNASG